MVLCEFKDIFGKPGEGVHSIRIANFAIIDILLTIGVSWFVAKYSNWNFKIVLMVMFTIGILAHRIFCVRTQLDKLLFNSTL